MTDDELFLAIPLAARSTGLAMNVWVIGSGRPRLLVQTDRREPFDPDHVAAVSVADEPRLVAGSLGGDDLAQVRRYIVLNRQALLDYWHERSDSLELCCALQPLSDRGEARRAGKRVDAP
jgi:hypothetical protein